MQEKIIILDFGSQTTQLIGRRVRELDTYCEIVPYNKFPKEDTTIKGVILSGSPFSVYDKDAFKVDLSEIRGKYPILGICYGAQFMSYTNGGKVEPAGTREYGRGHLTSFCKDNVLFKGVRENTQDRAGSQFCRACGREAGSPLRECGHCRPRGDRECWLWRVFHPSHGTWSGYGRT